MLSYSLLLLRHSFSVHRIEGPQDLRRHADAAPVFGCRDERGEDQRETRPLSREAEDDLRPASALLERPLQEIRGPDPSPVLRREARVG